VGPVVAALVLAAAISSAPAAPAGPPGDLLRLSVRRAGDPTRSVGATLGGARAVVSFWATYCAPCRVEVPAMRRAARRWGPQGVRVVGIALDIDQPAELARVAAAWGIDYESYWVPPEARDLAAALAPAGLPVTFFVTPEGVSRSDHLLTDLDVDTLVPRRLGLAASASPDDR
jgi:thiol-disulfide isomerase/thioredoxin